MGLDIGRRGPSGLPTTAAGEPATPPTTTATEPAIPATPLVDRAWLWYLILGVSLTTAYVFLHANILFNLVGLSSPIAILIGIQRNRPAQRLPWFLFAAGQGLFVAGDILTYNYPAIFGTDVPFPSLGDPLYLGVYPCLIGGLWLVVRHRMPGRDVGSLIDSLIIAIGAGTISWVLLLSPIASGSDSSLVQKAIAMGYPILDLVLLGVVVRLLFGGGRRPVSLTLLACAGAALFATDGAYSFISVQGIVYDHSGQLELGWGAFYLLWGAAALHGSMAQVTEQAPDVERPLTGRRLTALAAATLLAEVVHAVQDAADGDVTEPILYVVSVLMFILVLIRLAGLVQRQERSAIRERALREASATLVTEIDRDGIYGATIRAARSIAGVGSSAGLWSAEDGSADFRLMASDGPSGDGMITFDVARTIARDRFPSLGPTIIPIDDATPGVSTGSAPRVAVLLPLLVRAKLHGLLAVAVTPAIATAEAASLETLAAQAAHALESAEYAADLADRRSQQWFAALVQNASDVIVVIDRDTSIRFVSASSDRVLGARPDALLGRRLVEIMQPDGVGPFQARLDVIVRGRESSLEAMEFQVRHEDGHWMDVEAIPSNLLSDPSVKGIVLNVRDVSERKAFEAQLAHQAFYDSLTGLANRALFQNRVEHAMARRRRRGVVPAVLFMDLDDFKTINDSLGHVAGDGLLTMVGRRVQQCLRASDTAARLGGDEFAILVEDSVDGPADLAARVLASLEEPFDMEGALVHVRASIGIATATAVQHGPEAVAALLRDADVAMYSAKAEGGGRWRAFEPAMLDTARLRLELKSALDVALERDELFLHYQPIVDLASGEVRGMEALVRWMHPQRGLIAPLDFIPLAEETGLIIPIGGWVLREACRAAAEMQRSQPSTPPIYVTVNLSGLQLQRSEIVAEVTDALAASGLAPEDLVLEITESLLMRDIDLTIERLQRLKALGVRIAIDDFGTGYSSLNYLRRFPVDIVKIDRSFVDGIESDGGQRALVSMIIDLTLALDLRVVAEGIERRDQLALLRSLGCGFGQGYLFSRPVPLADLVPLLDTDLGARTAA